MAAWNHYNFFKLSEDFTMYLCGSTALNTMMVREKDTFGFVIAFTDSNMVNDEIVFAFSLLHRL